MTIHPVLDHEAGLPPEPLAAAAGDGPTASCLSTAGVDVVVAYHSSALRHRGHPSVAGLLLWASANEMALEILREIVAAVDGPSVFVTACANDGLRSAEAVVAEAADRGARGVLNAPTVGLLTGPVRTALETAGLGFRREIELMAVARARGLRAWGYAFTPGQAKALVANGAEAIVVHLGITGAGQSADRAARTLATVATAVQQSAPDVRVLAHGGPIHDPDTFTGTRGDTRCGFFGASALENSEDIDQTVRDWRAAILTRPSAPQPPAQETP